MRAYAHRAVQLLTWVWDMPSQAIWLVYISHSSTPKLNTSDAVVRRCSSISSGGMCVTCSSRKLVTVCNVS